MGSLLSTYSLVVGGVNLFGVPCELRSPLRCVTMILHNGYGTWQGVITLRSLKKILIGTWILWSNRNTIVHGGKGWSVEESVLKIEAYLHTFKCRKIIQPLSLDEPNKIRTDSGTILCDGSWCKALRKCG